MHRTYEEFKALDEKIRGDFWLTDPSAQLPTENEASIEAVNDYLQAIYSETDVLESTLFADFLGINWNGADLQFMTDFFGFLEMLLFARVPNFMPEPPKIEMDAFNAPETPFERYLYFIAFKHPKEETPAYLEFFNAYCATTPSWEGPEDSR